MEGEREPMKGLYIICNSRGSKLNPQVISKFARCSASSELTVSDFQPGCWLWARNVYRPLTAAPGLMVRSPYGRVELVLHGEVYNSAELAEHLQVDSPNSKSIAAGPELVAAGLEKEGMPFVDVVNGSFVLLAWYPEERRLYLANDRYGLRPHYYVWENETLLIAPKVSVVQDCRGTEPRLDLRAVVQLLAFQHLMGDRTLVDDVQVLPPGSIFEIKEGSFAINCYWDFPYPDKPVSGSRNELKEELQWRLKVAIERQLPADVTVGVPLSGGLDSRTLAGVASQSIPHLPTFTFGYPESQERRLAQAVSVRLGSEHYCISPGETDWRENYLACAQICEGMASVLHGHIMMILSVIKQRSDVVLDGLSGDMIFGSHLSSSMVHSPMPDDCADWLLNHKYNSSFTVTELKLLVVDKRLLECLCFLGDAIKGRVGLCQSNLWANVADYLNFRERQRRFILNGNTLLRSAVEVRTPFYDYDLMDFALSLPPRFRLNKCLYKDALRDLFPHLRDIPHTPLGQRLVHSYKTRSALSFLRRPDISLKKYVPSSIKSLVRRRLMQAKPPYYAHIFGSVIAPIYSQYDDDRCGWRPLTSFTYIEEVLDALVREDCYNNAIKLSTWLTLQMYREAYGLKA